jgi:hypothetical protein
MFKFLGRSVFPSLNKRFVSELDSLNKEMETVDRGYRNPERLKELQAKLTVNVDNNMVEYIRELNLHRQFESVLRYTDIVLRQKRLFSPFFSWKMYRKL